MKEYSNATYLRKAEKKAMQHIAVSADIKSYIIVNHE